LFYNLLRGIGKWSEMKMKFRGQRSMHDSILMQNFWHSGVRDQLICSFVSSFASNIFVV